MMPQLSLVPVSINIILSSEEGKRPLPRCHLKIVILCLLKLAFWPYGALTAHMSSSYNIYLLLLRYKLSFIRGSAK